MMGLSEPAVSLQMTQNREEWLIHRRVVLPSRGTWASWRKGLTEISWSSTRRVKSCTWGETQGTRTCWGPARCKAALQERTLESWWTPSSAWTSTPPPPQRYLMVFLATSGKVWPAGQERWSLPSTEHWWDHTWRIVSSTVLEPPAQERHRHTGKSPRWLREDLSYEEWLRSDKNWNTGGSI